MATDENRCNRVRERGDEVIKRFHAPGPWLTRDLKECVLASDHDAEIERLRGLLRDCITIAKEAHGHWDADRDSKVGKLLIALSGGLPKYDARIDAIHAALAGTADQPAAAPAYPPVGTQVAVFGDGVWRDDAVVLAARTICVRWPEGVEAEYPAERVRTPDQQTAGALPLWKPYRIEGRWPYWQCATPHGPYTFDAESQEAAEAHCAKERAAHQQKVPLCDCGTNEGFAFRHTPECGSTTVKPSA
jgi:hypothetical protein